MNLVLLGSRRLRSNRRINQKHLENRRPIGVFDSGLGGLTVVREIRKRLPHENIVYFGDIARLPYGTKSKAQIVNFSVQNTEFLLKYRVKAVVVACNSSSSAAFHLLRQRFQTLVVDVIQPAAEAASLVTRTGRIGLIATRATIESRAYEKALMRLNPRIKVFSQVCSLFVPLVEEGWFEHPISLKIARQYLNALRSRSIDTLILGCTHYPLLKSVIGRAMGKAIHLVDSAKPTVDKLTSLLMENRLSYPGMKKGSLNVYVSDMPCNFKRLGERFLGEKLKNVKLVRLP